ncbi:MAG: hypothetical protein ACK575_03335, partial [Cyanobacteriota bacterium]
LLQLLVESRADYTIFFRRLSGIPAECAGSPDPLSSLKPSFYQPISAELEARWRLWLQRWGDCLTVSGDPRDTAAAMKRVNPAITWREWLIAPAYEQAAQGDTTRIQELQAVFRHPYEEPAAELAARYDCLKPREFFNAGGVSHYSCSS